MSSDWSQARLGDYCQKIGSGATPRGGSNVYLDEGPVSLIRSQNIYNEGFKVGGLTYIDQDAADKLKNVIVEADDVLLNITGDSVARVCLAPEQYLPARVNQHVAIIRPDPKEFDSRFIRYYLITPAMQSYLLALAGSGATRNALTKGIIEGLEIPKPDINVQKEIADVLSSLDDKIQLNRQINQTLEQIAQAIFKSWFVDFEPVKAKIAAKESGASTEQIERAAICAISGKTETELDLCNQQTLQQLKTTAALFPDALIESELGEVPEGWVVKKIEDVIKRYSVGKKFSQKTTFESGAVSVLDQGRSGIIGFHNEKPGVKASTDDPIIVFANHTCYMRLIMHDFSAIQNVLPFKGADLNIYWIYLATYGKQEFVEYKGHWPDFVIREIVVPANSMDKIFGDYAVSIFKMIFEREKENNKLIVMRDTLLPKLLSGDINNNENQFNTEAAV